MMNEESDVTIGPGKLLGLFFMLVVICGVFFAIGYSLGKTSAREQALSDKNPLNASLSAPVVGDASAPKPSAGVSAKPAADLNAEEDKQSGPSGPDLTFFNSVKKSELGAQPPTDSGKAAPARVETPKTGESATSKQGSPTTITASTAVGASVAMKPATSQADAEPTVASALGGTFVVQIAAVTREEDAAALAGALRKKSYTVFVVNNPSVHDKFFHVQVGPFATLQDAEAMKAKLAGEGYNAIVKRG